MQWKKVNISEIKTNPDNPRVVKDAEFEELVESIKTFPKMLEIRPIVVNADMVILGGDKRYKACKKAGLKEVPIVFAEDLTEEEQREFIIKDNVHAGDWDMKKLKDDWNVDLLEKWGVEIEDSEKLKKQVTDPEIEITTEILEEHNYVVFTFKNQLDWQVVKDFFGIKTVAKPGFTETYQQKGVGRVRNGKQLLDMVNKLRDDGI